jgi:hypothetical protein
MQRIIDSKLIKAIRFSDQSETRQYLNDSGFTNRVKHLLMASNSPFLRNHVDFALEAILEHMMVYNYKIYFAISDMVIATFDGSDDDYQELISRATDLVMLRNMAKALAQSMFEGVE